MLWLGPCPSRPDDFGGDEMRSPWSSVYRSCLPERSAAPYEPIATKAGDLKSSDFGLAGSSPAPGILTIYGLFKRI